MLWNATSLRGLHIEAADGPIGTIADLLFDDHTWTTRWLVVETGNWFSSRKVLLPLSALGKPAEATKTFAINLTRQQIKDSPHVDTDEPVSRHREAHVYNYYGWNPYWTSGFAPMSNAIASPTVLPFPGDAIEGTDAIQDDGDPHLRSALAIIGYHIAATDGDIGHIEDVLIDDETWHLRYLTIDTKNWLPGERVILPVRIIKDIDWFTHMLTVTIDRAKVKSAPPYNPQLTSDGPYNDRSHQYFGLTILDGDQLQKLKIGAS